MNANEFRWFAICILFKFLMQNVTSQQRHTNIPCCKKSDQYNQAHCNMLLLQSKSWRQVLMDSWGLNAGEPGRKAKISCFPYIHYVRVCLFQRSMQIQYVVEFLIASRSHDGNPYHPRERCSGSKKWFHQFYSDKSKVCGAWYHMVTGNNVPAMFVIFSVVNRQFGRSCFQYRLVHAIEQSCAIYYAHVMQHGII